MSKVKVREGYYDNGKLYWRQEWLNGKYHGVYEEWYSNGQVWWRSNWRNDWYYGLYEYWNIHEDLNERRFYMI